MIEPRNVKPLPTSFAGLPVRQPREVRQYHGWSCLLTGKWGAGKTTLASTIVNSPICWNTLFVDIEGGAHILDDAEDRASWKPEEGPHLGIVEVHTWLELHTVMQHLITERKKLGINSAIFDNMGEALELCKKKHGFYTAGASKEFSLWDDMTNDMVNLFRDGRDLARQEQFVCIFVSWDTEKPMDRSDPSGPTKRDVSFNPKLAEKVMGVMDSGLWVETPPKPKPPYPPILHFTDVDPSIPVKKRINPKQQATLGIPDVIYNPDMGVIIDTLLGGVPFPVENHTNKPGGKSMQEIMAARKATSNGAEQ